MKNKKILFLILLFLGSMSASVSHAENYTFVTKWGSYGTGDGQFNQPNGVAVDSSGNVYVVDLGNYRIQKFDSNGKFITKWGSYGNDNGQFQMAHGVAVDSSDNVYVTDYYIHRIQKFNSSGAFLAKWGSYGSGEGQFKYPHGVAVDSSGNVYVADAGNKRIQKFDSSGTYLTQWGSDGQLTYPYDVTVDSSGNVYVTDSTNIYVYKFDSNGKFITKWDTSKDSDDEQLSRSYKIAVDSSGYVYVTNNMHLINYTYSCIQKFDSSGNFITKWGSEGSEDGQFCRPHGIAVDTSGYVYVSDDEINHRIQKFAKEKTTPVTPIITWNNPVDIISGTALESTQLNAVASVPGIFVYTPPAGTVLSAGTHTLHVDFTPIDAANYSNASKDVTINVLEKPVLPVANFSANVTSGYAPLTVQFTDLSTNATFIKWFFGDGSNSEERNPVHEFTTPGIYTVNLTAGNVNGTDSKLIAVNVSQLPPLPVVKYSAFPRYGKAPLMVAFRDNSTGSPYAWKWTFGDGKSSTVKNPIHEYSQEGTYSVTLTVTNVAGSSSFKKAKYIQVITNTRPGPYSSK